MTKLGEYTSPFNEEFCIHLEYHLCKFFDYHSFEDLDRFWCDGVSWNPMPGNQLSRKYVNDNRKIVTKAWIGENGQGEYEMTILFGKYAQRRYARGTSLFDCLPDFRSTDWIDIDVDSRTIQIRLK